MTLTSWLGRSVVVVGAARTPFGSFRGCLADVPATKLGSIALKGALDGASVAPEEVEEVFFGNVLQAGVGQAPARQVALGAGCPNNTEATTINKVCASGMKSVMLAAQSIASGYRTVMGAGGCESMSRSPLLMPRFNQPPYGGFQLQDHIRLDGLIDAYTGWHMGHCGEKCARDYKISREEQDDFARRSYERSSAALQRGAFELEVSPVCIDKKSGPVEVVVDEEIGKFCPDTMTSLPTLFGGGAKAAHSSAVKDAHLPADEPGTITWANSSKLADGAAALILTTEERALEQTWRPLARIIDFSDAALASVDWPVAPTVAIESLLNRHALDASSISVYEINEAFAVVIAASVRLLGLDIAAVNPDGGAVSLGHPFGASGARILVHLIHALDSGQLGIAAICNGGGAASAVLLQKL